jgi:hypothetical protein
MSHGDVSRVKELLEKMPAAANILLLRPSDETKVKFSQQPQEVQDKIERLFSEAQRISPSQQADIQLFSSGQQAMKQEKLFVAIVQEAPTTKISPDNRRQLLDRLYAAMQKTAEKMQPAMDRLGMK